MTKPERMSREIVYANIKKAREDVVEYAKQHSAVLEEIYDAIKPRGRNIHTVFITCPCGKPNVAVWKIKQHICTKKHRAVFPTPELSQFVAYHSKPTIDIDFPI